MGQIGWEETERLYSDRMHAFIAKSAEKAPSHIFQTGLELLKGCLKNNFYVITMLVLAEQAYDEALDSLFDQSIKQ